MEQVHNLSVLAACCAFACIQLAHASEPAPGTNLNADATSLVSQMFTLGQNHCQNTALMGSGTSNASVMANNTCVKQYVMDLGKAVYKISQTPTICPKRPVRTHCPGGSKSVTVTDANGCMTQQCVPNTLPARKGSTNGT